MTSISEIRARLAAANEPICSTDGQAMKWSGPSGGCRSCDQRVAASMHDGGDWMMAMSRPFIVCSWCGNKRCPKAAWHGNTCTESNDPGQQAGIDPLRALQEHAREDLEFLLATIAQGAPGPALGAVITESPGL